MATNVIDEKHGIHYSYERKSVHMTIRYVVYLNGHVPCKELGQNVMNVAVNASPLSRPRPASPDDN